MLLYNMNFSFYSFYTEDPCLCEKFIITLVFTLNIIKKTL